MPKSRNKKARPKLTPVHPGQVLKTILGNAGVTANASALALRIPANRLTEIVNQKRSISADTALRLAQYFGTSAQLWMNLQASSIWNRPKTLWPIVSRAKCSR